jgi:hypothetical protein
VDALAEHQGGVSVPEVVDAQSPHPGRFTDSAPRAKDVAGLEWRPDSAGEDKVVVLVSTARHQSRLDLLPPVPSKDGHCVNG